MGDFNDKNLSGFCAIKIFVKKEKERENILLNFPGNVSFFRM